MIGSRSAALWTLCLLLLTWGAEASGVHGCAHHARIGGTAAHAGHEAGHAAHQAPADAEQEEHEGCTCARGCPSPGVAWLPADAPLAAAPAIHLVRPVPAVRAGLRPRHPAPHFLPYAQAPPREA